MATKGKSTAAAPTVDVNHQSFEYYAGEGPVHRGSKYRGKPLLTEKDGIQTVNDLFKAANDKHSKRPFMGTRVKNADGSFGEYQYQTYGEIFQQATNFGSGLRAIGLQPKTFVGIYSINRTEWLVSSYGSTSQSIVFVPLYDTLGPDAAKYVVNHAELTTVVCSDKTFPNVAEFAKDCPSLKHIIVMDPVDPKVKGLPASISVHSFPSILEKGAKSPVAPVLPKADDLWCVMYTSGTTGNPKGVMVSNKNIISASTSFAIESPVDHTDSHISYLPLAHIYELVIQLSLLWHGASVGFWRGEILGLLDDMQVLKPTVFIGVPRVFNRVYDKVMAQLAEGGAVKRAIFNWAYQNKKAALEAGFQPSPIWDKLVFSKIQAAMGGRVKFITTGSAPLSTTVHEFLRVATNAIVVQGYGMTENCAACSFQMPEDKLSLGHCGSPVAAVEVKLVDVPEMGYTSASNPQRGEICMRGAPVFLGYFKEEEKTREVLEPSGWLHTGDIGEWLPSGALKIIDRKKNIFKLAQGEYVAAEYLETLFIRSKYVAQIFVYGDSFKDHLVGIVVPDPETLLPWAKASGLGNDLNALCNNPRVKKLVYDDMTQLAVSVKLPNFQYIKQFHLEPTAWTVENEMLTPSMKLKRPQLKNKYNDIIEALYKLPTLDAQAKL